MYAQRGHGKRSSFYSDYTFGVWREDDDGERSLTPVGKAYFGFTDEELKQLDKFVRDNTIERFGPVRVGARRPAISAWCWRSPSRACSARPATSPASPCAFPRINRIRWDKPAREADELATLEAMLSAEAR